MKKIKRFYLLYAILFVSVLIYFEQTGSSPTKTQNAPALLAEFPNYIEQDFTLKKTGFLQTQYKDSSGNAFLFPALTQHKKKNADISCIPRSYDLREKQGLTPIKNQKNTGCCWAFAALKALESNLIKTKFSSAKKLDLSESHLAWFLYHPSLDEKNPVFQDGIRFNKKAAKKNYQKKSAAYQKRYSFRSYFHSLAYRNGGNALYGAFILAGGFGAALEKNVPFTAGTENALIRMGNRMHKKSEQLRNLSRYTLTDTICYDNADRNTVKEAVWKYGALTASLFYEKKYLVQPVSRPEDYAYYQIKYSENAIRYANHCVNIIGWDDDYPKENFSETPEENGAWLVANSYGKDFGNNGCFWVSYCEPSLTDLYSFRGEKKSYDHAYQYDGSGWTIALAPQNENGNKAANIFPVSGKQAQHLRAVSFYTATDRQPYTISIYKNVKKGNPESGKKVLTLSGTMDFRGYHTIPIEPKILLKKKQCFSVVLFLPCTGDKTGYLPVEGLKNSTEKFDLNFSSADGESYCYALATDTRTEKKEYRWLDLNRIPIRTPGHLKGNIYHNVCLKAFTSNAR